MNLSQTEGPAVVVSVGTFVERVLALRDGNAEGKQARQLLAERGLDDSVLGEARTVLKEIGKPAPEPPPPDLEAQREEAYLAENELWSWYLEWSQIARGVVTDRGLLRQLDFLRSGRSDSGEDDDSDLEGETATAGPPLASAATA